MYCVHHHRPSVRRTQHYLLNNPMTLAFLVSIVGHENGNEESHALKHGYLEGSVLVLSEDYAGGFKEGDILVLTAGRERCELDDCPATRVRHHQMEEERNKLPAMLA